MPQTSNKQTNRLTFAAFVVLMVGLGSSDSLRGIFSTIFQQHFALSTTQLGLIVTVSYIGNLVFLLVGGNLSARFAKKRVLQVLMLIWMAALALFALTDSYPVLLVAMALAMGSSTLLNTTMNLITPLLFTAAPGFFVNFLFFTQGIGTSGSQFFLGSMADGFPFWQYTNLGLLVLGAAAFGMLLFCQVPEEPAVAPGALPQAEGRLTDRLGVVVPFVLVFGFYFITEHGVMNWLVAYGTTGLEMTQAAASRYLSVFYGGVMLGRLVLSPLVDKLGVIRSMQLFGVISGVLYVAGSLGGAALMPLWAASGFFLSILYPTLVMSIRLYFPAQQVSGAAGTIISIASLADILFNVGFGRLVDLAGYRLSICVLPVSMVLFLVTFLLFTRKCRPLKDQ
ncbi:sugar MFS transporter [uncultured Subdoligranulum sp.]|uniref:MFS transporter n=1 Tax=uncultured Subdoligranulum sp. TaxID=512298 RepID=UPI0025D60762|nr:MFS transporter [uncultured Subdoligranulum sp.]